MAGPLEDLSKGAKTVLELIVRQRVADGSSLMRYMGLDKGQDAVDALQELERHHLIELAGPITAEELPFSKFAVRPSAKGYLDQNLRYMKK